MKQAPRTLVITGASSGIGRELALQSAAPGMTIWLIGRNRGALDDTAAEVAGRGAQPKVGVVDLADLAAAGNFLQQHFPNGGGIDELYLAAAITQFGEVLDTLPGDWDCIYRTNLLSPVQWITHFYRGMASRGSGSILIISSLAAYAGYPIATAYATMKAGLLGLYRSLVHEGAACGVKVAIVSPGYVDTPIYQKAVFRNTDYEKIMGGIRSMGFRILRADEAVITILKRFRAGSHDFALPAYASLMKWVCPRLPWLVEPLHHRIVRQFRNKTP